MVHLFHFFLLIGFGVILFKLRLIKLEWSLYLEAFILKILLPLLIFYNIVLKEMNFNINERHFVYAYLMSCAFVFFISFVRSKEINRAEKIIKSYAVINVNTVFFSIPLVSFYLQNPSSALIINIIQPLLFLPLLMIALQFSQHQRSINCFFNFLSLPLLISIILGFLINQSDILIPTSVINILNKVSRLIYYIAPICFGINMASYSRFEISSYIEPLFLKLIIFPLTCCLIGHYLFQLEQYWLMSLFIISASPLGFFSVLVAEEFSLIPHYIRLFLFYSSLSSVILLGVFLSFSKLQGMI